MFTVLRSFHSIYFVLLMAVMARAEQQTSRKDRFGDPLSEGVVARLGTQRLQHGAYVYCCVFSPDGKAVASRGADRTVRIWDVATGKRLAMFEMVNGGVRSLAFSPDSKLLALSPAKNKITVVNWRSGDTKAELSLAGDDEVYRLQFASIPNSLLVLSKTAVTLWDYEKKRALRELPQSKVYALHGPTRRLATAEGANVSIWNLHNAELLRSLVSRRKGEVVGSIDFSPDGKRLAVGWVLNRHARGRGAVANDRFVAIYDLASGKVIFETAAHQEGVRAVAFSPDGRWLATGSRESLKVWDVNAKKLVVTLLDYAPITPWIRFSPDGKWLASAGIGVAVEMWSTETWKRKFDVHAHIVRDFALSPDGTTLATSAGNDPIRFWDVTTGQQTASPLRPNSYTNHVIYSPNGKLLISTQRGEIRFWDASGGQLVRSIPIRSSAVDSVDISPNGSLLATTIESKVQLWDVRTGRESCTLLVDDDPRFRLSSTFGAIVFSPDGSLLAAGGGHHGGRIIVWNVATRTELFRLKHNASRVYSLSFSPDGGWLLSTACKDTNTKRGHTIQLWDVASGKPLHSIETPDGCVTCSCFLSGGRYFATAGHLWGRGGGGFVRFWDTKEGKEIARIKVSRYSVRDMVFLLGEKRLVTAGNSPSPVVREISVQISPNKTTKFTPEELDKLWEQLAQEPSIANGALLQLVRGANQTIGLLRERLSHDKLSKKRLQQLIAKLDANEFASREDARASLTKLGLRVLPFLEATLKETKSAEVRSSIRQIMVFVKVRRIEDSNELRRFRALRVLRIINTGEAHALLRELASETND